MFNLLPWRWTHWVLLLVGPLFVVTYLSLLSWGPIDEALHRLGSHPGPAGGLQNPGIVRAEAIFSLVSLLLLTPLVIAVALFLLLFAMVILAITLGPLVRGLGSPDWVFVPLVSVALSGLIYAESGVWLPWAVWCLDRLAAAYLIPFL